MVIPKARVRTLIVLVAVVAIFLGVALELEKRRRVGFLIGQVALHAERQKYWADQAEAMTRNEAREKAAGRIGEAAIFASQAAWDRAESLHHQGQHRKYREALRRPGLPIEDDPRRPIYYPRDYLSKVPYPSHEKSPAR